MTTAHQRKVMAHTAGGTSVLRKVKSPKMPAAPSTTPEMMEYPMPASDFLSPAWPSQTVLGMIPPKRAEIMVQMPSANWASRTL